MDFERDDLMGRLVAEGFDPTSPAVFSWLGVVPYLTRPAVEAPLRAIGAVPAAEVVLDHAGTERLRPRGIRGRRGFRRFGAGGIEREAAGERGAETEERAAGQQRIAPGSGLGYHRQAAPEIRRHVSSLRGLRPQLAWRLAAALLVVSGVSSFANLVNAK